MGGRLSAPGGAAAHSSQFSFSEGFSSSLPPPKEHIHPSRSTAGSNAFEKLLEKSQSYVLERLLAGPEESDGDNPGDDLGEWITELLQEHCGIQLLLKTTAAFENDRIHQKFPRLDRVDLADLFNGTCCIGQQREHLWTQLIALWFIYQFIEFNEPENDETGTNEKDIWDKLLKELSLTSPVYKNFRSRVEKTWLKELDYHLRKWDKNNDVCLVNFIPRVLDCRSEGDSDPINLLVVSLGFFNGSYEILEQLAKVMSPLPPEASANAVEYIEWMHSSVPALFNSLGSFQSQLPVRVVRDYILDPSLIGQLTDNRTPVSDKSLQLLLASGFLSHSELNQVARYTSKKRAGPLLQCIARKGDDFFIRWVICTGNLHPFSRLQATLRHELQRHKFQNMAPLPLTIVPKVTFDHFKQQSVASFMHCLETHVEWNPGIMTMPLNGMPDLCQLCPEFKHLPTSLWTHNSSAFEQSISRYPILGPLGCFYAVVHRDTSSLQTRVMAIAEELESAINMLRIAHVREVNATVSIYFRPPSGVRHQQFGWQAQHVLQLLKTGKTDELLIILETLTAIPEAGKTFLKQCDAQGISHIRQLILASSLPSPDQFPPLGGLQENASENLQQLVTLCKQLNLELPDFTCVLSEQPFLHLLSDHELVSESDEIVTADDIFSVTLEAGPDNLAQLFYLLSRVQSVERQAVIAAWLDTLISRLKDTNPLLCDQLKTIITFRKPTWITDPAAFDVSRHKQPRKTATVSTRHLPESHQRPLAQRSQTSKVPTSMIQLYRLYGLNQLVKLYEANNYVTPLTLGQGLHTIDELRDILSGLYGDDAETGQIEADIRTIRNVCQGDLAVFFRDFELISTGFSEPRP